MTTKQRSASSTESRPLLVTRTDFDNPKSPVYIKGAYFDQSAVDRVVAFFALLRQLIGRWRGVRFDLLDWQVAWLVAPVFGWKRPDGTRVIRTVWFEIPRKNGKTTVCAGLGLYLLSADREPGAQVFAAAGDKSQAGMVFNPSREMARGSAALRKAGIRVLRGLIEYPRTGGIYRVLSSDGDLQHGLNVHGAVIDEVHVHRKRELIDALETGVGSRDQPLIVFITTADAGDKSSIYAEKRAYLEQVVNGTIVDPSFYGVVFAADDKAEGFDPFTDETIAAANPGAGVTVGWDYLRTEAKKAQSSPGARARYLRLHLNIRTASVNPWIDQGVWDANAGIVVESDLAGRDCFGGVDLASTSDFNAWLLLFPGVDGDEHVDVLARFWLPRAAVERRKDMRPYLEQWEREGLIAVTDGDVQDQASIRAQMEADAETFHILGAAYDPWNSGFIPELVEAGMPLWPLQQTVTKLNEPSKLLERLLGNRHLRHGGNPVLRWMAGNVQVFTDSNGNIKPDRKKSSEKIDGIAALVDGLAAWIQGGGEDASVYETRDFQTL